MERDAKEALFGVLEEKVKKKENTETYKVITVSLYNDDYELLNKYLEELKLRGYHRINKSKIIRYALRNLDIENLPKND